MRKLGHALLIALFVSFPMVPLLAVADTPQPNKMKECTAQAGNKKGDERNTFMRACLSGKPAQEGGSQQDKMTVCNMEASRKELKGNERNTFFRTCMSAKSAKEDGLQQEKMANCGMQALNKRLKGDARNKFVSSCLSGH